MKFLGKNNLEFDLQVKKIEDNFFQFYLESENGEKMGAISFKIHQGKAWIYSIATKPEFQHKGVGQTLIELFECYCANRRCYIVEGKYMPSNDFALPFYKKNGYDIYKDGYDHFIYKRLNIKNILNNFKHDIVENLELDTL